MAYTVRQVAGLSGVSIRTLNFYDEVGLLKPSYVSAGGHRYCQELQLLQLQQILFYREFQTRCLIQPPVLRGSHFSGQPL